MEWIYVINGTMVEITFHIVVTTYFVVYCHHVLKYFGLSTYVAAWELTRFLEDGWPTCFLWYLYNKQLFWCLTCLNSIIMLRNVWSKGNIQVSDGFWCWKHVLNIISCIECACVQKQYHGISKDKWNMSSF